MKRIFVLAVTAALLSGATMASAATTGVTGGGQPVSNYQPSVVMTQIMPVNGIFPCRDCPGATATTTLGMLRTFAGDFAIGGAQLARGQLLPINQNTALFSLLNNAYGGNGINTFALPDLQGRAIVGAGSGPGLPTYAVGQQDGSPSTLLTLANLPAHDHTFSSGVTGVTGSGAAFDSRQPSLAMSYLINTTGTPANSDSPLLGQIGVFGGDFAPSGWMAANGQLLSIASAPDLFSLIGTTYGGDGNTTFALPDLQGRLAVGASQSNLLGTEYGAESVTLTDATMPAHVHSLPSSGFTDPTGGGGAFDNDQPSLAINYLIATAGIFPPRDCCGIDPSFNYLGEVIGFAGTVAPHGWLLAQGQLLSISQNTALFSLLGTTYGGNGINTFALPDLRGRTILGSGNGFNVGDLLGEDATTLTVAQLPPHDHSLPDVGIPEPGAWALMLLGFFGIGLALRRRAGLALA
jgi:microcystin-dependent protein